MSGGSYDYLYSKDIDNLIYMDDTIKQMTESLLEHDAVDAAKETYELLQIIKQFRARTDVITQRLRNIWHAREWVDSNDCEEEHFAEELKKYRGEIA